MCDDVLSDFIVSESLEQRVCTEFSIKFGKPVTVKSMEHYLSVSNITMSHAIVFEWILLM